jgi:hypothetical protein
MEIPGNKPENPIWMALTMQHPKPKDVIIHSVVLLAPIAIAILMQKPALRQYIKMQAFHTSKSVCQDIADFWQVMATKSAQGYQKAQL